MSRNAKAFMKGVAVVTVAALLVNWIGEKMRERKAAKAAKVG
ncbi:MAG: hypothetical protein ACK4GU_13470 [Alishewanella aestuarii]